jgi:hypothetical protein
MSSAKRNNNRISSQVDRIVVVVQEDGNVQNNNKFEDKDEDSVIVLLQQSTSVDSADHDTLYDTFTSFCSPVCGEGTRLKSALKKSPLPGGVDAISSKRNVSFNSLTVREYEMTLGGTW